MPQHSQNTGRSFATEQTATCAACGSEFAARLWLIIDADERPELFERVCGGDLHRLSCPHCGVVVEIDAPLLIFRPDAELPLLFSPARHTSEEQNHEHAAQLGNRLRQSLGDKWQDAWFTEGIPGAPRDLLLELLSGSSDGMSEAGGRGIPVPAELRSDLQQAHECLQQYLRTGSLIALDTAAAACSRILEDPYFTTSDVRSQLDTCQGAAHVFTCRFEAHGNLADLDRALNLCQYAVEHAPADSPHLPTYWNNLGNVLRARYGRTGRLGDMQAAMDAFQKAVDNTPADSPELPRHLHNLATSFIDRHRCKRNVEDIDEAIRLFREAVACTPQDSSDLPRHLSGLGTALTERYSRSGPLENLEEAIGICQEAVSLAPPGSPELPTYLTSLAGGLLTRFRHTDRLEDLSEAIRAFQQAVASVPPDSSMWPNLVNNLATGLCDRFERTGRLDDLDEAIKVCREALTHIPGDSPYVMRNLDGLGICLSLRYGHTARLDDIEEAIRACRRAVECTPPGSSELASRLQTLANCLRLRYTRIGRVQDLDEAICVCRQAIACTPPESPELPSRNNHFGVCLRDRFRCVGRLQDLEEAVQAWRDAISNRLAQSRHVPGFRINLAAGLLDLFLRKSQRADLDEAIQQSRKAIQDTPQDTPELPGYLTNLGNGLRVRYWQGGLLDDMQEAIQVQRQALQRTPPNSPVLSAHLNNLGNSLRDRYRRLGLEEDLEEAIEVSQQATIHAPPNSPDFCIILNNLGTTLHDLFDRKGRLEDLEEAIRVYRQAIDCTPPESPELAENLNNLGTALGDRFERTGQSNDLSEAVRVLQQAVECTPSDAPELPRRLSNLGSALHCRFLNIGRLEDLDEAVRVYQEAVAHTPPNCTELARHLASLGAGLSLRFGRTGHQGYLEDSIAVSHEAVEKTSAGSPELPFYLTNLATGLSIRFTLAGQLEDCNEARRAYQRSCELTRDSNPKAAIVAGRSWGDWAAQRNAWDEAVTAYREALSAVDRLLRDQILRLGKESWLREIQGLAERMAYALAKLGRAEDAVVTLENGRARLLAEALEHSRRDLQQLPQRGYVDLYESYRQASETVQNLQYPVQTARSSAGSAPAVIPDVDRHRAIQAAREALDAAIVRIRQVAGFEDFLVTPTWDRIQQTVKPEAPLVYLVTTAAGSLALIVRNDSGSFNSSPRKDVGRDENGTRTARPDDLHADSGASVEVLWLDTFQDAGLNNLLVKRSDTEVTGGYLPGQLQRSDWLHASLDEALPELGNKLMGPVAERLRVNRDGLAGFVSANAAERANPIPSGDRAPLGGRNLRGIVLVPTGRLSLLPLHAARYTLDGLEVCLLEEFAVRYAISALALANARQETQARKDTQLRLVGVGNPLPECLEADEDRPGSLPFARAELESVADMLPDGAARTFFERNATRQSLLDALPGASLVHLSCHGRFRAHDPLESGLLLADGELTLRDIIASGFATFRACRLAVLSACQTAIQDFAHLPDEAIGLPAGLSQAGVPAVLGTLWSVNDACTALLMVRFYELLLQEHLPPPLALRQAQLWLRDATNAELDAYLSRHETIALARPSQSERMPLTALHTLLNHVLKGDPNARPYAHSYHWAPFVFYGAEAPL